ncbi:MAG: PEP-CTERM sorting domain-containing protein [Chthonomonas sp.]|nr:PEP-CTERM sorting domain-containing protein [Chthonomonas sp.]
MKSIFVLSLVVTSGVAAASFDMMYLPDETGDFVRRFDPVNRVSLGSFNALGTTKVIGNRTTSHVVTAGFSTNGYIFNGFTGEFKGLVQSPMVAMYLRNDGSEVISYNNVGLRRHDSTTGALLGTGTLGGTAIDIDAFAEIGGGRIAALGRSATGVVLQQYTSSLTYINETLLFAASTVAASAALSSMAYIDSAGSQNLFFTHRTSSNSVSLDRINLTSGGTVVGSIFPTLLSGWSTVSASHQANVMAGHAGSFFVIGNSTTASNVRIGQYYNTGGTYNAIQYYNTTALTLPTGEWQGANVVAPEPGTIIALGGGALALLRRRSRSRRG